MSYQRPRKCPICGRQMILQLTNKTVTGLVCLHPHSAEMVEKFKAENRPTLDIEGDSNEGTKGSNNDG